MELVSNIKNNYFKIYSETRGVVLNRKYIIKKNKATSINYFTLLIVIFICIALIGIASYFSNIPYTMYFIFAIDIIFLIYSLIKIILNYKRYKKRKFENTLTFSNHGFTDKSFLGIEITIKYEKIKALVIKKHSITLLTDTPLYFYFDKSIEQNLLKIIKNHKPDIKIIK